MPVKICQDLRKSLSLPMLLAEGSAEASNQQLVWVRETTQLKKPAICSGLQLPMFRASRDFIMLSLDGSRAVEDRLDEDQPATALSALDHYIGRPTTPQFNEMTLLHYVEQFTMPKQLGSNPSRRRKAVVVIVRPYFSPDPSGPKYEEYCRQKLIRLH